MYQKFRYRIAVFFAILFITIVSAPTIILSIDDSVDATIFLGENDEEEKENTKLLFDIASSDSKIQNINKSSKDSDAYTFKKYTKPHLNLIFPPPDLS